MRTLRIAAVTTAALLAGAALARADGANGAWDSFKPGTTVTKRTVSRMGGDAGDQAPQEERQTLVSVNDKEYVLKSEVKIQGEWHGSDVTVPRTSAASAEPTEKTSAPEVLGEDKLTIDGQDFVCKKTKTVSQGATTITWTYQDKDVLKWETTGPGEAKSSFAVTAIRKKVKVGGKDLECRETKTTSHQAEGNETTIVSLDNDTVPGRNVRTEMSLRSPGMFMTTVTEVTAYEVK
jgi:hypothetical protein